MIIESNENFNEHLDIPCINIFNALRFLHF